MKKILFLMITFLSFIFIFNVNTNAEVQLCQKAKSAILIDEQTGTILYDKNKDFRLAPASMTKVMTLAIIFDNIKNGNLKYNDMIMSSEYATSMGGSQVYLEVGEKMSLDHMLKAICIASANDAAVAVAEKIAGSESAFVEQMNNKAKDLGLSNTHFMDCTGLETTNHFTSAYDMAMMSKYLLNNHKDEVLKYTSVREDYLRQDTKSPFWLVNTNKLIGKYDGVDGLKTGWTVAAGYCLTATMKQDNNRLISVVMGYESPTMRNNETVELLNYGFANYKFKEILPTNHLVVEIKNIKYKPSTIKVVTSRNLNSIQKTNDPEKEFVYEVKLDDFNDKMKTNDVIGKYLIYSDGKLYDTIDLILVEDVKTNNIFQLVLEVIKLILL